VGLTQGLSKGYQGILLVSLKNYLEDYIRTFLGDLFMGLRNGLFKVHLRYYLGVI
jgi:hypothetical protein